MTLGWGLFEISINVLEACIDIYILSNFFPSKNNMPQKAPKILTIIAFSGVLCLYTFGVISTLPDLIPLIAIAFMYLLIFREGHPFTKLLWVLLVNALYASIAFITTSTLAIVFQVDIDDLYALTGIRLISVTAIHIVYLFIGWAITRITKYNREKSVLKKSYTIIFASFPLFSILFLVLLQKKQLDTNAQSFDEIVVIASIGMLAFDILAIILFDQMSIQAQETLELRAEAYYSKLQLTHQEEIKDIYEDMRIWRHDYKNHLHILQSLLHDKHIDEASKYINANIASVADFDNVLISGNIMIDALLNVKLVQAQKNNIHTNFTVVIPEDLPITDMQLSALIGNLLDNALEACKKISDGSRFINLSINPTNTLLSIEINNSTNGEERRIDSTFQSTKADMLSHGFGLRSIDSIVSSVQGYCERNHSNNVFSTSILLPLKIIE